VHGADSTGTETPHPIAGFVVKVATAHHRLQLRPPIAPPQPPPNPPPNPLLATRLASLYS